MQNLDKKTKTIIISIIVIILTTFIIYISNKTKRQEEYEEFNGEIIEENKQENIEIEQIVIHITGEVNYPGIVVLKDGSRIVDAIYAAGGEKEEADLNKLNLAYILNDGEKIYVPNKNEVNQIEEDSYISSEINDENTSSKSKLININTATVEELITLPGIGEATANKIIQYRNQNGKFKDIEEIKNIPGIGDNKFNNLKEFIKIK